MAEAKTGSRVFLLSSLALGVLAMLAAFVFLQNTAGKETGPKTVVLVASHDLRENTVLDPDKDIREVEVPNRMTDLLGLALRADLKATYKGQRVNRTILAGQLLLQADLVGATELDLHGDKRTIPIPGDKRAMSIPVKGAGGLSPLLEPGDFVRLMVTRPGAPRRTATTQPADPAETPGPDFNTVILPPTFKVLAVNGMISRSRLHMTAAEAYQSARENVASPTVTLEVTEVEAKQITEYAGVEPSGAPKFPITLLLCPPPADGGAGQSSGTR